MHEATNARDNKYSDREKVLFFTCQGRLSNFSRPKIWCKPNLSLSYHLISSCFSLIFTCRIFNIKASGRPGCPSWCQSLTLHSAPSALVCRAAAASGLMRAHRPAWLRAAAAPAIQIENWLRGFWPVILRSHFGPRQTFNLNCLL